MANQTEGFGFRQAPTLGSTPATGGQAEYKIKLGLGVGIFQNDPVSPQHTAGDDGYLQDTTCLLYTSPSPRDRTRSRMPSSA